MVRKSRIRKSRIVRREEPSKVGAYVITGLIVVLMVASIAGVALYAPQSSSDSTYGDYTFKIDQQRGVYTTTVGDRELEFNNLPYHVLGVPTDPDAINLLRIAPVLVVTFDPDQPDSQLMYVDYVRFAIMTQTSAFGAVTTPSNSYPGFPIIGCENATTTTPVIEIKTALQPAIKRQGDCILLEGNMTSLILAKDALLYQYNDMLLPGDVTTIPRPGGENGTA